MIPIPSISANRTPPTTAALAMACGPARAASKPPVVAPLMILFHGSSFCRTAVNVQSQQANNPPQTANCPPSTGARAVTALMLPAIRAPAGAIRAPLMVCHNPPPMAPIHCSAPTKQTKTKQINNNKKKKTRKRRGESHDAKSYNKIQ